MEFDLTAASKQSKKTVIVPSAIDMVSTMIDEAKVNKLKASPLSTCQKTQRSSLMTTYSTTKELNDCTTGKNGF